MNGKELMVGDFVKFTDYDGDVYASLKVACVTDKNEVFLADDEGTEFDLFRDEDLERVEPLMITKEFLEKNGFEERTRLRDLREYIKHVDHDELGRVSSGVLVTFFDAGTLIEAESRVLQFPKKIHLPLAPYIHQLQQTCRLCGIEIDWKL